MSADEVTYGGVVADLLASEADVRTMQTTTRQIDQAVKKNGGRTDLMPGRHLAIALTALEEARLRVAEAERVMTIVGEWR